MRRADLPAHQAIAAASIARRAKAEPADPVLLHGDLADAGDHAAADLVFPLARSLGTTGNVTYYWQRLLRLHETRAAGRSDGLAALSIAGALAKEEAGLESESRPIATGWPRLDRVLGGGFAVPSLNILGAAAWPLAWPWHVSLPCTRISEIPGRPESQ